MMRRGAFFFLIICSPATSYQLWSMPNVATDTKVASPLSTMPILESESTEGAMTNEASSIPQISDVSSDFQKQEQEGHESRDVLYSGNWVKKRTFLLKSHEVLQEINNLVAKIEKAEGNFNRKQINIQALLDNFYNQIGLDHGKVDQLFKEIVYYLDKKKRKKQEFINKEKEKSTISVREAIAKIEKINEKVDGLKKELEQLKLDVQSMHDLDKSLRKRVKVVHEQISRAHQLRQESEVQGEKIWDIVNHNHARKVYFDLKGSVLEQTRSIDSYVNSVLLQDFSSVVSSLENQIRKSEQTIDALEKKGIIIKQRAERVFQIKEEKQKQQELKELLEKKQKEEFEHQKKKKERESNRKEKLSWYTRIIRSMLNFMAYLWPF
jgi:hypothetical protein